jgi:hypothetical protein
VLCCRKYKITATSTKGSFDSQHASANPNKNKLFVPYLQTKENVRTAYVKQQKEQLNAQHALYGKPR